jgi:hypothetical protein
MLHYRAMRFGLAAVSAATLVGVAASAESHAWPYGLYDKLELRYMMLPRNLEQMQAPQRRVLDDVVVVSPGGTNSPKHHLILTSPKRDEWPNTALEPTAAAPSVSSKTNNSEATSPSKSPSSGGGSALDR